MPRERSARLRAEAYLNALARELGLASHAARVEEAGRLSVLVVERYDRVRNSEGSILRLHQEDAAQALGLPWGDDKYESVNRRASLRSIAQLLDRGRSLFSSGPSDRERLLAFTVLNVAAGNTDAHAKNFSLMLPSLDAEARGGWATRLAEAYDLVPKSLFDAEPSPFAMSVGGETQPSAITAEHLIGEGCGWGMRRDDAERVVAETLAVMGDAVGALDPGDASESLPRYLLERIENLKRGDRVWTRALPPALAGPGLDA